MMRYLLSLAFFLALTASAQAEAYIKPALLPLLQTMIRLHAIDPQDDVLLDDYAQIYECPVYQAVFQDDFKWNEERGRLRKSITEHQETFPLSYFYDTKAQLDRYDFSKNLYRFTAKSAIEHINALMVYAVDGSICVHNGVVHLPLSFRAMLNTRVSVPGLPLGPKEAKGLLQRLNDDKNTDHLVYVRFKFHMTYAQPWRKDQTLEGKIISDNYMQTRTLGTRMAQMDAALDSIDVYEDTAMTRPIYHYVEDFQAKPSAGPGTP